jgi:hypothetical protein
MKTYEGKPCRRCGETTRYISCRACKACIARHQREQRKRGYREACAPLRRHQRMADIHDWSTREMMIEEAMARLKWKAARKA